MGSATSFYGITNFFVFVVVDIFQNVWILAKSFFSAKLTNYCEKINQNVRLELQPNFYFIFIFGQ